MPELPEVETVKNELLPYVAGHRITGTTLLWEGIVKEPPVEEFRSRITGQEITRLFSDHKQAGSHIISWNGTDSAGNRVDNGVYFCRMIIRDQHQVQQFTRKLILMK